MTSGIFLGRAGRVVIAVLSVVAAGLLTMFASFVWPTAYRYDHVELGGGNGAGPVFPVRINRWSGVAEVLLPREFIDVAGDYSVTWVSSVEDDLPPNLIGQLQDSLDVLVDDRGVLSGEIFNGTGWRITKIRWNVTARRVTGGERDPLIPSAAPIYQPDETVMTRPYDERVAIEPNSRASLYLDLGDFGASASAELSSAWGTQIAER